MERITFVHVTPLPAPWALSPPRARAAAWCSPFLGRRRHTLSAPVYPSRTSVDAGRNLPLRAMSETATTGDCDPYAPGKHIVIEEAMRTPISLKRFWSAFDDFAALQGFIRADGDPLFEERYPANGVGAQCSYVFRGCRMVVTQETKDDTDFIVKFVLAPNSVFSFYEERIKGVDTPDGPEVSATVDLVFAESDPQERAEIVRKLESRRGTLIREIVDFVLERDGKHLDFEVAVERDIEELWAIIGDWHDVSWVKGATGVEVDLGPPAVRTIKFSRGETFEVLTARSEENKCLSYTVERSAGMPVDLLKDSLKLSVGPKGDGVVVTSSLVLLAKENQDADLIATKVKELFESRIKWVQATFAKAKQ